MSSRLDLEDPRWSWGSSSSSSEQQQQQQEQQQQSRRQKRRHFFFLFAGTPPFLRGGLAERIMATLKRQLWRIRSSRFAMLALLMFFIVVVKRYLESSAASEYYLDADKPEEIKKVVPQTCISSYARVPYR